MKLPKSRNIMPKAYKTTTSGLYKNASIVRAERRKRMPNDIKVANIDSATIAMSNKKDSNFTQAMSPLKLPRATIERNITGIGTKDLRERTGMLPQVDTRKRSVKLHKQITGLKSQNILTVKPKIDNLNIDSITERNDLSSKKKG